MPVVMYKEKTMYNNIYNKINLGVVACCEQGTRA